MVNKITKKAILKIKETVDAYDKEMAAINEKIATIDEKYRKLMEKETKELRESYTALKEEQDIWNTSLSRYDADVVNEVLGNVSSTSDDAEESEKPQTETITDSIFNENNEEEEAKEEEKVEEKAPVAEEVVTEETHEVAAEWVPFPESLDVAEPAMSEDAADAWANATTSGATLTVEDKKEEGEEEVVEEPEWEELLETPEGW